MRSALRLLTLSFAVAAALLSDKLGFLRGVGRLLRQVRIAVIINGLPVFFMLIIAYVNTRWAECASLVSQTPS